MQDKFGIRPLSLEPGIVSELADIIIETVANGDSVSFMHPLGRPIAMAFWENSLKAADRGERIVLGAFNGEQLAGTVTLLLDFPPNQPHRAEIAKMITRLSHRGRGIARQLMKEAERLAIFHNKTLLCLDTALDGGAARLYESLGYQRAGEIPDFALKPHGGLTATVIYWKRL